MILTFVNKITGDMLGVSYEKYKGLTFSQFKGGVPYVSNIHGIKLSKSGIYREHPDLINLSYNKAKKEAIKRLYKKLDSFENEEDIKNYVIKELAPNGYEYKPVNPKMFKLKG